MAEDKVALARLCARVADEKRGREIVILDLRKLADFADFFVIASAASTKQLQTIADAVSEKLDALGSKRIGVEGYEAGKWILLDYGSVICQLFLAETRRYYDLELLWGDAPQVPWADAGDSPAPAAEPAPPAAEE